MTDSIFNTYLNNIDLDYWQNLCVAEGVLRHYEKGDQFVECGRIARFIGYIQTGALKYVAFGTDGSESVVGLEFAGEFVADFPFSLYQQKSHVSIVAVTPCDILCVPTKLLSERLNTNPDFYKVVAESTAALFDTTYNRYIELYTKTAQQRYEELIEKHESLFSIFSLKDIASLLNITPTHLSRLRKL